MSKIIIYDYEGGTHIPFCKSINETLYSAINFGFYTFQFFMGNPHSTNRSNISDNDIIKTNNLLKRFDTNIFTHFPYISNLAGSVDSLAWDNDQKQDIKTQKVIVSLEYELDIISKLNCKNSGVIIHPGNFSDRNKGLLTISKSINKINFKPKSKLILENSAGQGVSLATTFGELKIIYDNILEDKKKNIGFCIDTCHIFAYGEYEISRAEEMKRMFIDFDNIIGIDKLSLIHLNDCETNFGSKKDRHACIGQGNIWKHNKESLYYLLEICKEYKVPFVLETEINDMLSL